MRIALPLWKSKPPACSACPALVAGLSFVPPRGAPDAPVLLLGQGPDESEAALGQPFIGRSGQKLTVWLRMAGLEPSHVRIANAVQCWQPVQLGPPPTGHREPRADAIEHCRATHWGGELTARKVVVAIGVAAMRALWGRASERDAGQWRPLPDGTPSVAVLHPAHILRGNFGAEPAQIETLRAVGRVVRDGWVPPAFDFSRPPPGANLFPTLDELRAWRAECVPGDEIALDVECAGRVLRMVGLGRVRDLSYVAVWFRKQGGDPWPYSNFPAVVEWLYDLLADESLGLVMHNHGFDVEQLEEVGFKIARLSFDTLLASHLACPEVRKRLESVALLTSGMTGWKRILSDAEGDQK